MAELLNCPFCGGEAKVVQHEYFTGDVDYGVECKRCKTTGYQFWGTEAQAAKMWNTRAESNKEWISVADRLPKLMTNKVLVCCKNGYVGFGHYEDYKGRKTWYNLESQKPFSAWNYGDDDYEVDYWKPLPEPPK